MNIGRKSNNDILFINFNQDASCISVGTRQGYHIYNCDPIGKWFSKSDGGIGIVEMMFSTSLVALVGAGEQPTMSPRRLQIINTKRQSTICEIPFTSAILAVKLNRKRLVVVLEEHIYIYDISNMKLLHTIDTAPNPNALFALAPSSDNSYLAYPPSSAGAAGEIVIFDTVALQPVNILQAHKSPLSCVAFNQSGTMVATASDKGTVIRVFAVPSGQKLYQFRRGTYPARIYSISFNSSSTALCVSSATDTVHIFKLDSRGTTVAPTTTGQQDANASLQQVMTSGEGNGNGSNADFDGDEGSIAGSSVTGSVRPSSPQGSAGGISGGQGAGAGEDQDKRHSSMYSTLRRSQLVSRAADVGSYVLPDALAGLWEPARDFAYAKLPAGSKGQRNICCISNTQPETLMVVTAAGRFFQYSIDTVAGGECLLLREASVS